MLKKHILVRLPNFKAKISPVHHKIAQLANNSDITDDIGFSPSRQGQEVLERRQESEILEVLSVIRGRLYVFHYKYKFNLALI